MKILVIEDDNDVIDTIDLTFQVGWPGIELVVAQEGKEGIEFVEVKSPDIVILDLGLPDINGYEVLRQIRAFSDVPIIILTVMNEENDIIKGLELGADDYITKPFRKMELLARIKAILRRQNTPVEEPPLVCGAIRYEPSRHKFFFNDTEIILTATESGILRCLMKQADHIVTHSSLAESVWGSDYSCAADTLKVHIRHLREKLEMDPSHPQLILTRPGIGYTLIVNK